MTFNAFVVKLQLMEDDYNEEIDRKFNVNTCTKYPRKVSRYLTFILYNFGFVKGHHVLAAHFISDLVALYYVYLQEPFGVLGFLLLSHLFDNCDGDLARIRGEADPKWGGNRRSFTFDYKYDILGGTCLSIISVSISFVDTDFISG